MASEVRNGDELLWPPLMTGSALGGAQAPPGAIPVAEARNRLWKNFEEADSNWAKYRGNKNGSSHGEKNPGCLKNNPLDRSIYYIVTWKNVEMLLLFLYAMRLWDPDERLGAGFWGMIQVGCSEDCRHSSPPTWCGFAIQPGEKFHFPPRTVTRKRIIE